ncbi:chloramphenicol phosphotransferase [Microbacterium keratanolyticum]|uniref:phosphotransferase-like protein n=1 Tax=Microbacterium keratanolyticum TaxID=67574 RepID=UPI00362C38A6
MTPALPPLIVINSASSAGGTTVARLLQKDLPDVRLLLGVDAFIDALPDWTARGDVGLHFGADGEVTVDATYREREDTWYRALAALAASGQALILDEVLLDGGKGQERLRALFAETDTFWVGVRCDAEVAEAREAKRPDRIIGMARDQAERVHEGVVYDVVVDGALPPQESVDTILDALGVF